MSDDESAKMLDIINAGTFCDLSYGLLRIVPGWSMEYLGKNNIASYFAKSEKRLQEKLDKFVEQVQSGLS